MRSGDVGRRMATVTALARRASRASRDRSIGNTLWSRRFGEGDLLISDGAQGSVCSPPRSPAVRKRRCGCCSWSRPNDSRRTRWPAPASGSTGFGRWWRTRRRACSRTIGESIGLFATSPTRSTSPVAGGCFGGRVAGGRPSSGDRLVRWARNGRAGGADDMVDAARRMGVDVTIIDPGR